MFTFPRRCEGPKAGAEAETGTETRDRDRETDKPRRTRRQEAGERQQDRLKYRETDSEQATGDPGNGSGERRVEEGPKKDAHKMRHEKKQKEALPAHNAATLPV